MKRLVAAVVLMMCCVVEFAYAKEKKPPPEVHPLLPIAQLERTDLTLCGSDFIATYVDKDDKVTRIVFHYNKEGGNLQIDLLPEMLKVDVRGSDPPGAFIN